MFYLAMFTDSYTEQYHKRNIIDELYFLLPNTVTDKFDSLDEFEKLGEEWDYKKFSKYCRKYKISIDLLSGKLIAGGLAGDPINQVNSIELLRDNICEVATRHMNSNNEGSDNFTRIQKLIDEANLATDPEDLVDISEKLIYYLHLPESSARIFYSIESYLKFIFNI